MYPMCKIKTTYFNFPPPISDWQCHFHWVLNQTWSGPDRPCRRYGHSGSKRTTNRNWPMANRMVIWPRQIMRSWPSIYLGPIVSTTAGDRDLVAMEHLRELTSDGSNCHVTNNVTWPWKVNTQVCLEPISTMVGDTYSFAMQLVQKIWPVVAVSKWSGARWRHVT